MKKCKTWIAEKPKYFLTKTLNIPMWLWLFVVWFAIPSFHDFLIGFEYLVLDIMGY